MAHVSAGRLSKARAHLYARFLELNQIFMIGGIQTIYVDRIWHLGLYNLRRLFKLFDLLDNDFEKAEI